MIRLLFFVVTLLATAFGLCGPCESQMAEFDTTIVDNSLIYDVGSGEGAATVQVMNHEQDTTPGFPHTVQGWSMAILHDDTILSAESIEYGAYIQSLNGGAGPGFWEANILPDGITIGTVYGFLGGVSCFYDVPKEIVILTYATVPSTFAGDTDGATTDLEFGTLGTISTEMIVSGASLPVTEISGAITLTPGVEFNRGDCNGDNVLNLADPIFLGQVLFGGGSVATCLDACDGNDDGNVDIADVVYVATHLFGGTPAPPAPFLSCGFDPTEDAFGCDFYACP